MALGQNKLVCVYGIIRTEDTKGRYNVNLIGGVAQGGLKEDRQKTNFKEDISRATCRTTNHAKPANQPTPSAERCVVLILFCSYVSQRQSKSFQLVVQLVMGLLVL